MGIVLQDPFLFSGTVASNVSLENENISKERIVKALRDVGAERFANNINEEITEKGSTLSTGERQLISFARALAFDPAILILDEATSSIDTETEAMIQQALEVVKKEERHLLSLTDFQQLKVQIKLLCLIEEPF